MATIPNPPTADAVEKRLVHWREVLLRVQAGVDTKTTRGTCWMALDRWLDEMVDQQGSSPLADVWDREWRPSWPVSRMYRGIENR